MTKIRQSNIELLRIISMIMVLIVHIDGASIGLPQLFGNIDAITPRDAWRLIVESITIIGVNCFVLISGYFSIKASFRGLLRFLGICLFYSVSIYLFAMIAAEYTSISSSKLSIDGFINSFMIITHNDLWFVPAYFGLYIISPFINKATETLNQRDFTLWLGVFIAFNLYAGWYWGESFNPNGYSIMQLLMLYLIGRYINRFIPLTTGHKSVMLWAMAYIICVVMIFTHSLYATSLSAFAYNSPFVVASSICFFMIFRSMSFSSNIINYIAASAFSVYLIHKNPLVWGQFRKWVVNCWEQMSLVEFSIIMLIAALLIYALCVLIDRVRIALFKIVKL